MPDRSAQILQFIRREHFTFITLACALIVLVAASAVAYPATHALEKAYFGRSTERVTRGVSADEQYVYHSMSTVAASPDLAKFIASKDILNIASTLQREQRATHLDAIDATDENGVALSRLKVSSRRGDYVFQTTPYGRAVARGTSTVSIERGTALPLIVIAGFPIEANGRMVGAVFGGYSVDDAYAHAFRQRYLDPWDNLVFYSKEDGVIGTTFENPSTKALLSTYFSTGSDWIQKTESDREVVVEGRSYFVKNLALPGLDGSAGGMLVLYPVYFSQEAILLGLIAAFLFSFIVFYFHTREASRQRRAVEAIILGVFFIVVFVAAYGSAKFGLFEHAITVEKTPYRIYNSTLSLAPDSGIFSRAYEQQIAVNVSTGGEDVNAIQLDLSYDPTKLRVADILTADTFCGSGFVVQKTIDNKSGHVEVACGVPTPGFTGTGTVVRLDVQPLQAGEADLAFASGTQVLANDGLGTNVLRLAENAGYRIVDENQAAAADKNGKVLLFSPTQPNSARWYDDPNVEMTWLGKAGYTYRYAIDKSPTIRTLSAASSTTADAVTLRNLPDGIYYFHIAAEKDGVISPISSQKVMIDTTPPSPPVIRASQTKVSQGEPVRLEFSSSDALSGLERNYYVKFDDRVFLPAFSPLYVSFPAGRQTVTVRAFDDAGNYSDSSITFDVAK